ncbi:MAG: multicopper oxidase domain-containing protein, partial [Pseudomonadales bacterium]|nr:multicopper oxidase domain-containing protein [Pseudomonadales bacterium]
MNNKAHPPETKLSNVEEHDSANLSRRQFLSAAAITGGALVAAGTAVAETVNHAAMGHGAMAQGTMANGTMDHAAMGHSMGGYDSMMFMKGHKMSPGLMIEPPGSPSDDEVDYRVFDIDIRITEHEILPGVKAHMFAFNGQVPGPEFHVMEGDWIKVNFTNHTEEMHTIHWHGIVLPYTMDGVPMVTQDPVHPGQTFVYRFQAKPSGTRWYHCHWGTPLHATHAMHGAFIIHRKNEPLKQRFPYARDYTLLLQAWDLNFLREELNGLHEGMK